MNLPYLTKRKRRRQRFSTLLHVFLLSTIQNQSPLSISVLKLFHTQLYHSITSKTSLHSFLKWFKSSHTPGRSDEERIIHHSISVFTISVALSNSACITPSTQKNSLHKFNTSQNALTGPTKREVWWICMS